ncbi:MAG TPA: hypothetical protein VHG93_20345 [Longimicrobium sp.]|nr:hypothetical protein [Longimicrobium sp.]
MRLSIVSFAVAVMLAACGPAVAPPSDVPSLEPRNADAVRIYWNRVPRCGFRDVGNVSGRDYRDLKARAFRMHANAVILDAQHSGGRGGGAGLSGMAVAFTRADCQQ